MNQRACIIAAAALWASAFTTTLLAFANSDVEGLFETANMLALVACVPSFYLVAEHLFERYHRRLVRERRHLFSELAEALGRADAVRDLSHIGH